MLLVDSAPDWPYTFVHMSDTMSYVPLSNNGHISAMTDSIHSINACGQVDQLQVWKLLQHSDSVVFPEGINGESEALQFSFRELPLWNAASTDGPALNLSMLKVALSGMESETASLTQVPPLPAIEPLCDIATVLNLHLQGALEWLQLTSSVTSVPLSQHSTPGRKLLSVALGAPPSTQVEDLLSLQGTE